MEVAGSPALGMDITSFSQHYSYMAQVLRPFTSSICHSLDSQDVKPIGRHPTAAGGSADVWEGVHGGRKVALKSYRCYVTSDAATVVEVHCVHGPRSEYTTDISQRLCNEVRVWSLLYYGGVDIVPLVGVYSTETHPFTLVYEYAHGLDLQQYLKGEPRVGRLNLVFIPLHVLSILDINL